MRSVAIALFSALALAACGQSGTAAGDADSAADGGGGLFPNLFSASYRAEATITGEDGQTMPVVTIRDGRKLRMEINAAEGQTTIITDAEAGESFIITTAQGRTVALRASGMDQQYTDPADSWSGEIAASATRTGNCSVAGETGAEWTKTTPEDGTDMVCVTEDGIILRATDDGRTVWETTQVQRGPQAASLFELPEGVQVMDLGNMGGMMEEMMRRQRAQP
jgi:hypothetical protein